MQMVREIRMEIEPNNRNGNGNGNGNNPYTEDSNKKVMIMYDKLKAIVGSSAVVVFSSTDCCMCLVAKRLLFSLGVGPTVVNLDTESGTSDDVQAVLYQLSGEKKPLPAIFVGGKFLGGIESLMAAHINGSLVPLLKEAGALWL